MEVMSYTERLRLVRSWNQLSGKRTKGIGPNEFPKKGMSDQSGVFRPFYVVERVRGIVGESRAKTLPYPDYGRVSHGPWAHP